MKILASSQGEESAHSIIKCKFLGNHLLHHTLNQYSYHLPTVGHQGEICNKQSYDINLYSN